MKEEKLKVNFSTIPDYCANTGLWTWEDAVWGVMKVGWDGLATAFRARELFGFTQKGLEVYIDF